MLRTWVASCSACSASCQFNQFNQSWDTHTHTQNRTNSHILEGQFCSQRGLFRTCGKVSEIHAHHPHTLHAPRRSLSSCEHSLVSRFLSVASLFSSLSCVSCLLSVLFCSCFASVLCLSCLVCVFSVRLCVHACVCVCLCLSVSVCMSLCACLCLCVLVRNLTCVQVFGCSTCKRKECEFLDMCTCNRPRS